MKKTSADHHQNIIDYYEQGEKTYQDVWDLKNSLAIHFGYSDATTKNFSQSLIRFNEVLAEKARITADDKVLDAGCGVGGSSIFLAQHIGCQVVGISLSEYQIASCRKNSQQHHVSKQATFQVVDYCDTPFESESFDVIWALESVCYAKDKAVFLKEAYRLLKKGGRLIVADGFATRKITNSTDNKIMQQWANAWAVESLAVIDKFCEQTIKVGFKNLTLDNVTQNITPSSKRLYYLSQLVQPVQWLHKIAGRSYGNIHTINNGIGAYYQYKALQKDLWRYYIVSAVKG